MQRVSEHWYSYCVESALKGKEFSASDTDLIRMCYQLQKCVRHKIACSDYSWTTGENERGRTATKTTDMSIKDNPVEHHQTDKCKKL